MGNLDNLGVIVVVLLLAGIIVVSFVVGPDDDPVPQDEGGVKMLNERRAPDARGGLGSPSNGAADRRGGGSGTHRRVNPGVLSGTGGKNRGARSSNSPKDPTSGGEVASRNRFVNTGGKKARGGGRKAARTKRPPYEIQPRPADLPGGATGGFPKSVQLRDGESIWNMAVREYGPDLGVRMVNQILRANGIGNARSLLAGKAIKLPVPDAKIVAASKRRRRSATGAVRPVAFSGGPSFAPDPVSYPVGPAALGNSPGGNVYVVQSGDNLGEIAVRFLGSVRHVSRIMALNGLKNADKIWAGMTLKIPAR